MLRRHSKVNKKEIDDKANLAYRESLILEVKKLRAIQTHEVLIPKIALGLATDDDWRLWMAYLNLEDRLNYWDAAFDRESMQQRIDGTSQAHDNYFKKLLESRELMEKYAKPEIRLAADPNANPKELKKLSKSRDKEVLTALAGNPSTSLESLVKFSKSPNRLVRGRVAENPSTPPEVLVLLSKDPENHVLLLLAANPFTPLEGLLNILKYPDPLLRTSVAVHRNLGAEILEILAKDEDPLIRENVAFNHNTNQKTLVYLSQLPNKSPQLEEILHKKIAHEMTL